MSITISIADFSFQFNGLDSDLKEYLKEKYKGFIFKKAENPTLVNFGKLEKEIEIQNSDFELFDCESHSGLAGSYFFAFRKKREEGTLLKVLAGNKKYFLFAVENFLRWMIANSALSKNGLLLHASSKVIDNEAHIFLGNHGAGKSTAVSLIDEGFTIADDVALVMLEENSCFAYNMPAVTKFVQKEREIGRYEIKAFYKLIKSDKNKLRKLAKPLAFAAIVSSIPFLLNTNRHHYIAKNLIERLPVYELYFKKEKDFFKEAINNL
ncbi:MAG: hypothetical protein ACPLZH_02985 [Minisyncoccales bacterium]